MSSTTIARPIDVVAHALALESAPAAEFAHLDPRTLAIEVNVRPGESVDLSPAFVGSIRQYGVLMPILVVRQSDGTLQVRAGQRRVLGAIEAGVWTIPARIIDAGPDADRLVQQIIENDQRKALTDEERVAGYEQMHLDFGLTAEQIAGRLSVPKETVKAALRVAKSPNTRPMLAAGLTIVQSATIATFDDDPQAVARLTQVATDDPDDLPFEIQVERDRRATAREAARLADDLITSGTTVIEAPGRGVDSPVRALTRLRDDQGQALTVQDHSQCPGHAAYVGTRSHWSDDPCVFYVCTDFSAHGHQVPAYDQDSGRRSGPMTEDEKIERARVVAGNRSWKAATTVRRDWLRGFGARKSAPKGATALLAYLIANESGAIERGARSGHALACDLLGLTTNNPYAGRRTITDAINAATPGRQQVIALMLAVAAVEDATTTDTWRSQHSHVAVYFRAIQSWGHTLNTIEVQAITGQHETPQDADDTTDVDDTLAA